MYAREQKGWALSAGLWWWGSRLTAFRSLLDDTDFSLGRIQVVKLADWLISVVCVQDRTPVRLPASVHIHPEVLLELESTWLPETVYE